uniref:Uncharacterized protein n=1 Tax=Lygus hesperus TaxID=30085 RepID=A0A146LBC1_LYGHE
MRQGRVYIQEGVADARAMLQRTVFSSAGQSYNHGGGGGSRCGVRDGEHGTASLIQIPAAVLCVLLGLSHAATSILADIPASRDGSRHRHAHQPVLLSHHASYTLSHGALQEVDEKSGNLGVEDWVMDTYY